MKVWEKIAEFSGTEGWAREKILSECFNDSHCPAATEEKYHFIGDSKFKKHCNAGCGVKCLEEYLDLEVKGRR